MVFLNGRTDGEMAEWLKAHAWKACLPQGNVGSNPTLSAIQYRSFNEQPRPHEGVERLSMSDNKYSVLLN